MNTTVDIKKQIEDKEYRRYTISVVSGQESLVVDNLSERVKKQGLTEEIVDFMSPIVPEVHYRKGKKVFKQRKLYPGYVFVKSKMDEKIWYVIRNTPGVRLIVGAEIHPIPLTQKEYEDIVKQVEDKTRRAEHAVPFQVGDVVLVKEGEFDGMKGVVTEIDEEKGFLYANVEMLGRNTPIMVSFEKVEAI